ncbi:MAG: hypothetical protein IJ690_00840 [Clostridia bacterium]|nr:hypothetical protein [Clostridia bacterium]
MNENVKLDIAIEIMSSKVAEAMERGNKKEIDELLEEREQMYLGNWDVINKILDVYSEDVKR